MRRVEGANYYPRRLAMANHTNESTKANRTGELKRAMPIEL